MTQQNVPGVDPQIQALTDQFRRDYRAVQAEIAKSIVGHEEIIDGVLTCLFVGGHALLEGVIARQAELVARWLLVGFIHGVMNTDNTSISGETIDYGPCAFMDHYDPAAVFSSTRGAWTETTVIPSSSKSASARRTSPGLAPS